MRVIASFDLYYSWDLDRERFTSQFHAGLEGRTVHMDGIDGFYDQYFEAKQKLNTNFLRFLPLPADLILLDAKTLEELTLFDGQIVSNCETFAEVLILSAVPFCRWCREVLDACPATADLPRIEEVLPMMLTSTLGVTLPFEHGSFSLLGEQCKPVRAVHTFRHQAVVGAALFTSNAMPSYVVRLSGASPGNGLDN